MAQETITPQSSYEARARQHAPKSIEEFQVAVRHLIDGGTTEYGVSAALGVSIEQIRRMIGRRNCE